MRFRRADVAGGTYFFTVNLAERKRRLLVEHVDLLRDVLRRVKARYLFHIDAMVILPEHLHAVWTMPQDDRDYSTRWMLIKAGFSRGIAKTERRSQSRVRKGERGIWQRRFWEHVIRDDRDYEKHVDYIHYNPVKHGYVKRAADWPHSSIHRFIAAGLLPHEWGADFAFGNAEGFGEER